MTKNNAHNNYAFIDSQNLNLGIRSQGWSLDFEKFRVYLRHRFRVKKAFLFIGYIESNQKLYNFLEEAGFILVFKPTVDVKGSTKGNVDAELVLHSSAIEYENYEQAVIVTGDGDFHCLVDFLADRKKLKRLLVPNIRSCSRLLKHKKFKEYRTYLSTDELRRKLSR